MKTEETRKLLREFRDMHAAGAAGSDREMLKEWADAYYFSREDLADVVFMMLDETIVVEVTRYRCGQNCRLGDARVADGPAYVKAHSAVGPLGDLCVWLSENGHTFTVRHRDVTLSIIDYTSGARP